MDKTTAQRLVRDTFKTAFDRKRFRDFVNELCREFNENKAQSMGVPDAFDPHVKSCQRLGTFESPLGELLDVLVVYLTESSKLERTRTALRDFVAHKLKRGDGEDNAYKEAALVAFVAPDSQSWRFSYVRMEYETKRDRKTGKIKPEERLTPARRYSYLVGAEEECHTAQSRFLSLFQNTADRPTLAQIEEAFSVESVTREFFREYVRLFDEMESALSAILKRDKAIRNDFSAKGATPVDFAKKLLGQIVFLYFIQKKGWLGVPKGEKWGNGPRNYLRQLAAHAIREGQCLFNDVLEPLFYDTLATDRGHEAWCKDLRCRIPFLNGGLFEPLAGYDWKTTDITLPNSLFTNQVRGEAGDVGTGILDIFDRYNFTVNEAEPLEQEVAIDPEMLGKVFENLIEDNRRKGLGAFYTPREIVHFMCQECLIDHLDTALNRPAAPIGGATPDPEPEMPLFVDSAEKPKARSAQQEITEVRSRTLVPRQDLEAWIRQSDQFAHYAAAIAAGTKGDHYPKPPDSIRKFAHEIDVLLRDITVCDPAIGSGAFPVGMMTEIVRARLALTPWFNDVAERTAYQFKRHVIQSCIYGVDIDPGAVEIAKLRLWLSLVVDEDDVQQIKPLPNLDYKVVVGNSLLGFPFRSQRVHKIEKLKADYFGETDHGKKRKLKNEIDAELTDAFAASKRSLGYEVTFDFQIHFSEVFRTNKGFDVVIGNPPYVRHEAIKELKPALKSGGYECFTGTADLYVYFYERGVKLLRSAGTLAYISSNSFLNSGFGEKLRRYLTENTRIRLLIDFAETKVFEAVTEPCVICLTCDSVPDHAVKFLKWDQSTPPERIWEVFDLRSQTIQQRELKSESWQLESPAVLQLLEKLRRTGKSLGEHVGERFYYGIKTGLNEAFLVGRDTRDQLICEHKSSARILKPFLRGRDVKRWRTDFSEQYLVKIESSENKNHPWSGRPKEEAERIFAKSYPAIYSRFERLRRELINREDQGTYFWELRSCAYWQEFERPKILYQEINRTDSFAFDDSGYFANNKLFMLPEAPCHWLGLLNSRLGRWYLHNFTGVPLGGFLALQWPVMKTFPIPVVTPAQQKAVERKVERVLAEKKRDAGANISTLEREIDQAVYALYALTPEEIQLIEATTA